MRQHTTKSLVRDRRNTDSSLESNTSFYAFSGRTWLEIKTSNQQAPMSTALSLLCSIQIPIGQTSPVTVRLSFKAQKMFEVLTLENYSQNIFAQLLLWILYTSFKQERTKLRSSWLLWKCLFVKICFVFKCVFVHTCARVWLWMHVYLWMHMHASVHKCVWMYACAYMHSWVHMPSEARWGRASEPLEAGIVGNSWAIRYGAKNCIWLFCKNSVCS